jgi:hypothetical protein
VDQYVTPDSASSSGVPFINIVNGGTGLTNGNNLSIITITGANTTPAIARANVSGGSIVSIRMLQIGKGYDLTQANVVINTTSFSTTPVLSIGRRSYRSAELVTDIHGKTSGTLLIPNDQLVHFPTGVLTVEFSDNFLNPSKSQTYAKTTFTSKGALEQSGDIVTTRPEVVTPKILPPPPAPVKPIPPASPTPPPIEPILGQYTTRPG